MDELGLPQASGRQDAPLLCWALEGRPTAPSRGPGTGFCSLWVELGGIPHGCMGSSVGPARENALG